MKACAAEAKAELSPGVQLDGPDPWAELGPSLGIDRGWAALVVKDCDLAFFFGLVAGLGLKDCSSKDRHL